MASTASTSEDASSSTEPSRMQAEPLPTKRGEIGFRESMFVVEQEESRAEVSGAAGPQSQQSPSNNGMPNSPSPANSGDASSIQKSPKKRAIIDLIPVFRGVGTGTVARLLCILSLLVGTIVAWILAATRLSGTLSAASTDSDDGNGVSLSGAGIVFVHVAFGMAVLAQLVFLERTMYNYRGQRYNYLHPGEILPRHRRFGGAPSAGFAFAPWNRPPIPTYAAAIADNGGTGDVEDNEIAVPPPPAYGHTRGSALLLSGFLRNSLRQEIHNTRRDSQASQETDRPLSYVSQDSEWDARCDAVRAIRLEETLTRLQRGPTPLPPTPPNEGDQNSQPIVR